MAKVSPDTWAKAKALREAGKSFREIEKLLNIPFVTISDRSKKEGWEAGKTEQLIIDAVRVESEIRTLETVQKEVVTKEVTKRLAAMDFYSSKARDTVELGFKSFKVDPTPLGMKTILDGLKSGMQVEGLVPFYPSSSVFNNVNAQNNEEKIVKIEQVIVDSRS
jgi:hypothetical protein